MTAAGRVKVQFFSVALAVCLLATAVGWLTGLRGVLHGLLLFLSIAAFLPLIAVSALVVLIVGIAAVAALGGGADNAPDLSGAFAAAEGLGAVLRRGLPRYYRFLFARRHPAVLGFACGLLLGALALGMLVSLLVVPSEVCTLKRMAAVQTAVEQRYKDHRSYPSPLEGQWVNATVLSPAPASWPYCSAPSIADEGRGQVLLDGFGRRLRYEVVGAWPLGSYRIVSSGFDGRASGDDICLGGKTRAAALLAKLAATAGTISDLRGESPQKSSVHRWWSALRSTGCSASP